MFKTFIELYCYIRATTDFKEKVNAPDSRITKQNNSANQAYSLETITKNPPRIRQKSSNISSKEIVQDNLTNIQSSSFFTEDVTDINPEDIDNREQIYYLDLLKNSTDPEMRISAIEELDDTEIGMLLQYLQTALDDDKQSVRIAALKRLSDIELYGAIDSIVYALDDPNSDVVLAAIDAAEETADESLIPKLMPLLQHPDNKIRKRAEEVIEFMN